MKHFVPIITFLGFLLIIPGLPASAQSAPLTPEVKQAERYLQNLGTARARFLQTAPNGAQLIGTFYLDRPGKLRFEYDDPIEDFVVADGMFIYFYDSELGEQTNAPIGQTLADFILRRDLQLFGDVRVTDVKSSNNLLQVTLVQSADPAAGAITLGFSEEPFALKKWRITDSMGSMTEVELFDLQTGIELADNLFIYVDPRRFDEPRYND